MYVRVGIFLYLFIKKYSDKVGEQIECMFVISVL